MPSRVVHIRLDDWVILGCHDILQAGENSIENIPMATIVRNVLTALVRKLQNTNQIPIYTKEEAYERAMELYGGAKELDLDVVLADLVQPEETSDEQAMEDLLKETLRQIENEGVPMGIAEDVQIAEVAETSVVKMPTLNLLIQSCTPFAELRKQSPKDRFIEWANEQDALIQQAVAVAYTGLPKQLWGTEKAEHMIKNLLERHRD